MTWRWLSAIALSSAAMPATAAAAGFNDADGLQVVSQKQLDARLVELTVRSAALPGPAHIRILLPETYVAGSDWRYPVLYLLHGTSGGAADWTNLGDAERATAGLPLIVVMPDIALNDDGGGWCTNWPDRTYSWETFHIDQLVPWIDHNLRTIPRRAGRAIAGLSQGGFCSMSYAARHPDLFSVGLAYSGAPDIYYDADARAAAMSVINATEVGLDRVPPDSIFGDPVTDAINWAAHDPTTLAENLRWTKLYMYFGNGQPGPYDTSPSALAGSSIEALVWRDNIDYHNRLDALGIPSVYDPYGPGTHAWPYWSRDLRWSMGPLMSDLAHPSPPPSEVNYTSAEDRYSVYSWSVRLHRNVREFSTLGDADARGFSLAGSGSATVLTPPVYKPGSRYRVTLSGDQVSARTVTLTPGYDRRLEIGVSLGPSNLYQQDTAQAVATGTVVYTTYVTIDHFRR
jgi:S-formylglutathione hydrolase FrmB